MAIGLLLVCVQEFPDWQSLYWGPWDHRRSSRWMLSGEEIYSCPPARPLIYLVFFLAKRCCFGQHAKNIFVLFDHVYFFSSYNLKIKKKTFRFFCFTIFLFCFWRKSKRPEVEANSSAIVSSSSSAMKNKKEKGDSEKEIIGDRVMECKDPNERECLFFAWTN